MRPGRASARPVPGEVSTRAGRPTADVTSPAPGEDRPDGADGDLAGHPARPAADLAVTGEPVASRP